MGKFDDVKQKLLASDDLEYEMRTFLENHTITELLEVVQYCVSEKEDEECDRNCEKCVLNIYGACRIKEKKDD